MFCFKCIKINAIVNKFLLAGDKFRATFKMTWFYLQCLWSLFKNTESIEKFMQTGNTDFIYKNELDKACFQHEMAYGKSKYLAKKIQSKF